MCTADDDEKPLFASLLKGQSINDITLEQALDLFRLPRTVGERDGKKITAAIGRFGPYLKWSDKFVSLREADGDDPLTVTLERALELIDAKISADAARQINVFDEQEPVIKVLNGRFGPYISIGKENIKIPKDTDPASLTREDCLRLQAEAAAAPKKKTVRKSASAAGTASGKKSPAKAKTKKK